MVFACEVLPRLVHSPLVYATHTYAIRDRAQRTSLNENIGFCVEA